MFEDIQKLFVLHPGKRAQKHGVPVYKRKEPRCRGQYLPWAQRPASENGTNDLATSDVNVLGQHCHQVIGGAETVCGDIGSNDGEEETKGCKECCCPVVPAVDEMEWIPEKFTVDLFGGRCHSNAWKQRVDERKTKEEGNRYL